MQSIWQTGKKPLFVLAPMDGVTDVAFREILAEVGRPDIFFTEFTNVEGLCSIGKYHVEKRLAFTKKQTPIIAQIWGLNPENFYTAAGMIADMGFDGIDINMGCPVKDVVKTGACSAMIDNPTYAKEVIDATKRGAKGLPVSVKTRLGTKKIITTEWIGFLLEQQLAAITLHGRIAKEMSKYPANWEEIGKAVQLRNMMKSSTVIIGNGDVRSQEDALEKIATYGVDGVMIGRGIFSNLWIFRKEVYIPTLQERIQLLMRHITLFTKKNENKTDFNIMKKFFKVYIADFPDASEFRTTLMSCKSPAETITKLEEKLQALG